MFRVPVSQQAGVWDGATVGVYMWRIENQQEKNM